MQQIALVGCAHIHVPGFIKRLVARPDFKVKYAWDHDLARAQKRAPDLNATATTDLASIWADPDISAAIICTETNLHEQIVIDGAAAKKHLFVEKPLGIGAAESYRMAKAIDAAGVLFQTGYFNRGNAIHLYLRDHLQRGSFGKLTRVRMINCHHGSLGDWFTPEWLWMTDPKQAGMGAFGDLGTHALDMLLWLFGEVERVTASIGVATGRYGDCDEFGESLLHFTSGVVGTLAASWVDIAQPVTLTISGTKGHAYIADGKLYFKSELVEGATGTDPVTDLPAAWPHAFDLFLDAVAGQPNVPLVTAQEAAVRSAVMEALYASAKQQGWVAPAKG
jgi:predicted dehydrogenase